MADLATRPHESRELSTATAVESFTLLDAYAGGRVAPRQQQPTLATISAGYRPKRNDGELSKPVVSRDGTIYVNGRENLAEAFEAVPGLAGALQATKRKRLTIAFPFDDPGLFIQQHFACYSATALQLYGDEHGITRIHPPTKQGGRPTHARVEAGTDEYAAALQHVKVQTSVYFCLATWEGNQPRVIFPDGAGLYRLRMTSRNSAQSLLNSLRWIAKLTGGRIAGVPFDLFHINQDVVAPDGKRRAVPVWQLVLKPPRQLSLTTGNFQEVMGAALEQGERLRMLPAPEETAEYAAIEGPDVDLDDPEPVEAVPAPAPRPTHAEVRAALRGGLCNPGEVRRIFFGRFGGGPLGEPGPRAEFLSAYTNGRCDSLSDFLEDATPHEANAMLTGAQDWVARGRAERPANVVSLQDDPARLELPDDELEPDEYPDEVDANSRGLDPEPELEDEQPAEAERPIQDDDLFTVHRQRCAALEQAKDAGQLSLAWEDVQRDSGFLGPDSVRILTGIHEARQRALGGQQ